MHCVQWQYGQRWTLTQCEMRQRPYITEPLLLSAQIHDLSILQPRGRRDTPELAQVLKRSTQAVIPCHNTEPRRIG